MAWFPTNRGRGGGGSLVVATRSDNNNPAAFADFAALETYTATQDGTADANRINVTDADDAREVFAVGTLDSSNQVTAITAAYIRLNDAWVAVATNLVGTPGAPGQDGVDGTALEFETVTARDNFFVSRPDLLRFDLPILVGIEGDLENVIEPQKWKGATSPASYTPATDAVFFVPATIRADSSSFELARSHRMSAGGENVHFENLFSGNVFFPPWQYVGDHTDPNNRVVSNRPTARTFGALEQLQAGGPVSPSGAVDFNAPFDITTPAIAVFGIEFVIAETYNGLATLSVDIRGGANDGANLTNRVFDLDFSDGDSVMLWLSSPLSGRNGLNTQVSLRKPDGSFVQGRPFQNFSTIVWSEINFRNFTDDGLAYESEIPTLRTALETAQLLETLTGNDRLDYSAISNTPTIPTPRTDEEIRDVSYAGMVGGNGITVTVDDANNTVTISAGGGGNPPADADRIYYGLASSSDTTTIDVATLTRENDPTNPDTISSGLATQGQYFVLFVPMTHDITSITDTVLQQDVTSLFTSLDNAQLIDTIQFKSYIIGPLNAGFNESYEVAF